MPQRGEPHDRLTVAAPARSRVDAVGLALLAGAVGWTFVSAAAAGGSAAPAAAVLAASGGALALGRAVSAIRRSAIPALVTLAAAIVILMPGAFDRLPLQGPFGYANAAGAFFAVAVVAALMVAAASPTKAVRVASVAAAGAFAAVPVLRGSLAPAALLVLGPAALLLARDSGAARLVVAGCAALFVATLVATVAIGATAGAGERSSRAGVVEDLLSARRVTLWRDALSITAGHPLVGVGPGRFAEESEVARRDADAGWAHHEFLQQGAEQGIVGFALLVALVLWGFARLWVALPPDRFTALGAAALAVVAVHACVDYVLHFPAIPIACAALVGAAQASVVAPRRGGADVEPAAAAVANGDR